MKRVVITGLGALTPIGNSVNEFWESAIKGKTGASKITKFDPSLFKTTFASEIKNFTPENYLDRNEIKRSDPFTQYALCSVTEAFTDSGIDIESISPFDIGVIWGSGQGGMQTFEEE
ncbi:MAG TPA: beta-ketoacyl-[acyl-carrier-protein] synthase II, partial [Arenibacter sp.]|nr:beta-ketoacyl-[acyl-carrier-protein] synthase II [Arenibacter sp.]